jgi:hypothetical protein
VREELQLVLDVLRREQRAVDEPADVLRAVDDLQVPVVVEEARVAGHEPAVGRDRFGRGVGPAEVLLEHAWRSHLHLAAVGDPDLHAGQRLADGVELHLPVRLLADVDGRLGLTVELLQVDADRAVEIEEVGTDRLAAGVRDADARHPQDVAQRTVDQEVAERSSGRDRRSPRPTRPSSSFAPTRFATAIEWRKSRCLIGRRPPCGSSPA